MSVALHCGSTALLSFSGLNNQNLNSTADCFTVYMNFRPGDTDTFRWHYRIDTDADGCEMQIIDFTSFNGIDAPVVYDNAHRYYTLLK